VRSVARALIALFAVVVLVVVPHAASARYVPPPIRGHVTDEAGKLTATQRALLDEKLEVYRLCSTNEIAVLVAESLRGESIEDVAYATFNTWEIGAAGHDNGVLLVVAPRERKIRIETGKGVGGQLTDIESSEIIEKEIAPRLKVDAFFSAIDAGTTAIGEALGGCPSGSREMAAAAKLELETRRAQAERAGQVRFVSIVALVLNLAMAVFALVAKRRRVAVIAAGLFVVVGAALALQGAFDAWAPPAVAWIALLPLGYWLMDTFAKLRGWKAEGGPGSVRFSSGGSRGSSGGSGGGSSYTGGGGRSGGGGASGDY
jgi:uncharacterized protein